MSEENELDKRSKSTAQPPHQNRSRTRTRRKPRLNEVSRNRPDYEKPADDYHAEYRYKEDGTRLREGITHRNTHTQDEIDGYKELVEKFGEGRLADAILNKYKGDPIPMFLSLDLARAPCLTEKNVNRTIGNALPTPKTREVVDNAGVVEKRPTHKSTKPNKAERERTTNVRAISERPIRKSDSIRIKPVGGDSQDLPEAASF